MGSEALIVISDDEDDAYVKPLKQKKRSLLLKEDLDVIVIEEETELVEERDVSVDDDCCIINYDPQDVRVPEYQVNDGDDLVVVGERGPVACRDYPHARHLCLKFPFKTTSHEAHCDQCHCYVCDVLAPCLLWGLGKQKTDHCHAFDKDENWKKMRDRARSPPAKLAAKIVIRPRILQSPAYIPNYQNGYHSSSNTQASNVNSVPDHTISHIHVAAGSQSSVLRPTSGLHLLSDIVSAPDRMQQQNRLNIALPNWPIRMMNISRCKTRPSVPRSTNIHIDTPVHDVGLEDSAANDAPVIRLKFRPSSLSSSVPISQEFLPEQGQEQLVHRWNAVDSGGVQMAEVNSSGRPNPESLKRSSASEHIGTGESVEMPHSGKSNEFVLPNNDGIQTYHMANGETMQTKINSMHTSTTSTSTLAIPDLFDVGILEEIFGNEQFQNLWDDMP